MTTLTTQEIILLEMTTLEISNSGSIGELRHYLTSDFKGLTSDGVEFTLSEEDYHIYAKNNIIITEETFDIQYIDQHTYQISYLAISDYAHKVVRHLSIWVYQDGKWLMKFHKATSV